MTEINYKIGRTASKFHACDDFARAVIGPFGSGKSVMGLMELLLRGLVQKPGPDNIRRTRAAVIRNTFPELKSTTIQTYRDWFGQISKVVYTSPITATLEIPNIGDGTGLHQLIYFLPLDDESAVQKLMSLELTYGFIDEVVYIPERVLEVLSGRVGRFPAIKDGGPSWYGIWATTNPCPVDHWFFKLFEEKKPEGYRLFHQPPGLIWTPDSRGGGKWTPNPYADNIMFLPEDYYVKQAIGKDEDYIKTYLCGEYGELRSGKPVYPMYNDDLHCAKKEIIPHKEITITIGVDVGIHGNAAVFTQLLPTGQFIVFDELLAEDMSVTEFVQNVLKPHIYTKYFQYSFRLVLDPAATARSQSDKRSALDIFKEEGLPAETAKTNEFIARREAVVYFLTKQNGFLLDTKCVYLRRGLISKYRYAALKGRSDGKVKDKPEKNLFSHNADALQYAALHYKSLKVKRKNFAKPGQYTTPAQTVAGY